MASSLPNWLREIGVAGIVDIAIIAVLIYTVLIWLKRTRRAAYAISGIAIASIVYLAARELGLKLTASLLQAFFAVFIVALVVIFQQELRYFFEQVAHWSLSRRLPYPRRPTVETPTGPDDLLVRAAQDLATDRIGALMVLRGRDLLLGHLAGGEDLDGRVSEALLKSIFDPSSIGHDGAVVLEGERVSRFGCHLPLSESTGPDKPRGTRHSAALGLAERTDALCIVVSEERGTISVARHGRLRTVDPEKLRGELRAFRDEVSPTPAPRGWRISLRRNFLEKAAALAMASALWFVLVHEAGVVYRTFEVPVVSGEVLEGLEVREVRPEAAKVTLSAPRRTFWVANPGNIEVRIPTHDLPAGAHWVALDEDSVTLPPALTFEQIEPPGVMVTLGRIPPQE